MDFLKTVIYLGTLMMTTAGDDSDGRAENVHWVSSNFKTLLTWTPTSSEVTYIVRFTVEPDDNWEDTHCIRTPETECDMTNHLEPLDRAYIADIQSEISIDEYDEELPHTMSVEFNPYKESQITAASFSAEPTKDNSVILTISDPITSITDNGKLLTIRDVLKKDLKYKINYSKAGSTGKKEHISDSSVAVVTNLDPGQGYCFTVAAFIPSRPKLSQLGAWSQPQCTTDSLGELNIGLLLGIIFILLIIVIVIILAVAFLCCRRKKAPQQTIQTIQLTAA